MHIKLTEYIRATALTLNIKDAPMTALPLIKDAFAKLATDLEELMPEPRGSAWNLLKETAGDVMQQVIVTDISPEEAQRALDALKSYKEDNAAREAMQTKRRGRPPKVKEEPTSEAVEPTPLEQAIAKAEDEQSQGETSGSSAPAPIAEPSTDGVSEVSAPVAEPTPASPNPVSDSDLQKYCVKLAQHYGGPQKVFDLAKPFVEEGAVPRPSNIKGDDKRWQFIKAVEEDSNVRYHG